MVFFQLLAAVTVGTFMVREWTMEKKVQYVDVNVRTSVVSEIVSDHFLSVTLDTGLIKDNWMHLNLSSPKVLNLARHLNPVYLRVGGSLQDFLYFDVDPPLQNYSKKKKPHLVPFYVTSNQLDELFTFTANADWNVIFGLNMLNRNSTKWDPLDAKKILTYLDKKGYNLAGLELGNEPDVYNLILSEIPDPVSLGKDFQTLRSLKKTIPSLNNTLILGPDVTNMCALYKDYKKMFCRYLDAAHTALDAVTIHHYYMDGAHAKLENFYDRTVLNKFKKVLVHTQKIINIHAPGKKIWIGETASAWNSGAANLTDAFVDGFMWLDKLGLAARYNVQVVLRQAFYGGNYGLIDFKTLDPNPDYWLSVLYKKLVDTRVLYLTASKTSGYFRVYVHCTNQKKTGYPPGSVTVYALNVSPKMDMNVTFSDLDKSIVHVFHLTPVGPMGLRSKTMALNGTPLKLLEEDRLPEFTPKIQTTPVVLPKLTFGFYVFPNAKAEACM